jgi:hypothetical protein
MQLQLLLTHYYTDVLSHRCLQDAPVDVGTTLSRQMLQEELLDKVSSRAEMVAMAVAECNLYQLLKSLQNANS